MVDPEKYGKTLVKLIKLRAAVDSHRDAVEQALDNDVDAANERLWAAGKEAWRD